MIIISNVVVEKSMKHFGGIPKSNWSLVVLRGGSKYGVTTSNYYSVEQLGRGRALSLGVRELYFLLSRRGVVLI